MPGLSGLALTIEQTIEILSLYAASKDDIPAVAAEPGWTVFGGFPMPTTATIRIDVFGSVSDPSLTLSVRLYCVTDDFVGVVSGSLVSLSSLIDKRFFSGQFELPGGRDYQFQVQVVGAEGDGFFGFVRRAAPAGI